MNVVEMPLADLMPAAYNPRKALRDGDPEYAKLRRSIEEFGLVDPIIWNSRTRRVVGGHQRLTVLRNLGRTTVLAASVPERVVMEILGHSTLAMVKRYQHVLPGLTIAAAERVDRVMGR